MPHDLTRATLAASARGYDLTKAVHSPGGTQGPMALARARQTPGAPGGADVAKVTTGASTVGKAMPRRAKKKG